MGDSWLQPPATSVLGHWVRDRRHERRRLWLHPGEVVPIVHLHGTADQTVAYDGGVGTPGWGGEESGIIDHWTGLMGTTTLEETALPNLEADDVTSVDFLRYAGAPGGQEFHHYRVNEGGHDWFGVWGSQDIQATEILWDFSAQCSGAFTDVPETEAPEAVWMERQGPDIRLHAGRVEAFDLQGRQVEVRQLDAGERWTPRGWAFGCSGPPAGTHPAGAGLD